MNKPICFVLMPFGKKIDSAGSAIDFDLVYSDFISPAIHAAGLTPLRANEEMTGGIIHKAMFERLILCEYAVADLTTANANVFYELGLRHAVRPWSTVLVYAKDSTHLPFDVAPLRAMQYSFGENKVTNLEAKKEELKNRLVEAQNAVTDSPIFQLVDGYPEIDHTKTDIFRERVQYSEKIKKRLAEARQEGLESLRKVEASLGKISDLEAGVVIDLMLSYRATKGWLDMIKLVERMSSPLAVTLLVQEQLAFAHNRLGNRQKAKDILIDVLNRRGPSSETYGILGRVYKDMWEDASKNGQIILAEGLLDKAIDSYLNGFQTDWRDAYPGINAITLMQLKEPPDPRMHALIPVVTYAVERKIASGKPDYWDHATRLELAIHANDKQHAMKALSDSLASVREQWELETTARNLRLLREVRRKRNEELSWEDEIASALDEKIRNFV